MDCRPPTGPVQLDSLGAVLRNVCLWQVPRALVIAGWYDSNVWTPGICEQPGTLLPMGMFSDFVQMLSLFPVSGHLRF